MYIDEVIEASIRSLNPACSEGLHDPVPSYKYPTKHEIGEEDAGLGFDMFNGVTRKDWYDRCRFCEIPLYPGTSKVVDVDGR